MSKILFENINKIYDNGFQATYDFNLEIDDGEFVVFVGPSGCGKSTMIRMIAGLETLTTGKLYFDGQLMNNAKPNERGIAMVFQSYALYPHLDVAENMGFALTLEGFDEDFIEKRVKEVAKILGLESLLDRKPRQLSGGQRQRVAVGRAIIRSPKVFLMDEPLSNLDAKQRVSMRSEIIEIHRRTKATTVYVTHDQVEAMTMADKIVVMKDGRIQQAGTPKELYFTPKNKFVAGFVGDPPMNFLKGEIVQGQFVCESGGVKLPIADVRPEAAKSCEGKKVYFGFRPEAVTDIDDTAKKHVKSLVLSATADLTENLGDNANLYATLGETDIIIKIPPELSIQPGRLVQFMLPAAACYLFDCETEECIGGQ